jgi:hypothetical protein
LSLHVVHSHKSLPCVWVIGTRGASEGKCERASGSHSVAPEASELECLLNATE